MAHIVIFQPDIDDIAVPILLIGAMLGKGSKTPVTENVRDGRGIPPFSANFIPLTYWPAASRDGGRGGTPLAEIFRY